VGFFDHAGVLFSLEYSLFDNLDILIRVIRRLTCDMSLVDLGHDRLVTLLDEDTYYQDKYPRFKVRMGGPFDTRCWITEGLPIWVSRSLFGRGTSVWHVRIATGMAPRGNRHKQEKAINKMTQAVLKVAWRAQKRETESSIYATIKSYGSHCGIAQFLDGGDAMFPVASDLAILVNIESLRNRWPTDEHPLCPVPDNAVLHRVLIRPVGRGLWTFESERELVEALRSALAGVFASSR
jgi:hypothetical protein